MYSSYTRLDMLKVWILQGVECWGRQMLSVWVRPRQPDGQTVRVDKAHQWLAYIQMSQGARLPIGGRSGREPEPPRQDRGWSRICPVENVSELSIIRATCRTAADSRGWEKSAVHYDAATLMTRVMKHEANLLPCSLGLLTASQKNVCQILVVAG